MFSLTFPVFFFFRALIFIFSKTQILIYFLFILNHICFFNLILFNLYLIIKLSFTSMILVLYFYNLLVFNYFKWFQTVLVMKCTIFQIWIFEMSRRFNYFRKIGRTLYSPNNLFYWITNLMCNIYLSSTLLIITWIFVVCIFF